jgi:hypothetical protein
MEILNRNHIAYEDELPKDITDKEYDLWYENSWVEDGVRIGYQLTRLT